MDQKRLVELEKLAGLELEASERAQFLVELRALEDLASDLPPLNSVIDGPVPKEIDPERDFPDRTLDEATVQQNAPDIQDGLFRIPAFKDGHGSKPA